MLFRSSKAARRLNELAAGKLELRSFRDEDVLTLFPQVKPERCERAIQHILLDGRVYEGAEGTVQALQGRWRSSTTSPGCGSSRTRSAR